MTDAVDESGGAACMQAVFFNSPAEPRPFGTRTPSLQTGQACGPYFSCGPCFLYPNTTDA
jgi:hypothetical protein